MTFNDTTSSLRVWWSHKYNKPLMYVSKDDYVLEELLLEWNIMRLIEDDKYKKATEDMLIGNTDEEWLKTEMGIDYFKSVGAELSDKDLEKLKKQIESDNGEIRSDFAMGSGA